MDCRVNRIVGSSRRRLLLACFRIATTETEPYRSAERTGTNPTKATTSFKHFVSSCELGHDTLARQEAFSSCGFCQNRQGLYSDVQRNKIDHRMAEMGRKRPWRKVRFWRILLPKSKIEQPQNLAKVDLWAFLLLRRSPYRPVRGRRNNSSISTPNESRCGPIHWLMDCAYHPPHPAIDSNRSRTSLPTTDRLRGPRCSLTASCHNDILMILVEENGSHGMPQIAGGKMR